MRLKKGDIVEVSSDEEGFSGVWFPATILRKVGNVKGKTFLVEFRDLMTDDEKSKLKEKVKAHMIRPEPPALNRQCFYLNEEVDAYDQDGWWRGVVYGISLRQNKYVVYFNQTLEKLEYDITQLRLHQDWTHNKWVTNSENVGMNESNPQCPLLSARNVENIPSKSVKRSNKTNKKLSEAKVSEFSGESKADRQSETLKDGSSQPTKKSSKRKQGTEDQSNNGSAHRRKIVGEENVDGTETQDKENLLNSHAKVVKRVLLKGLGSPTESEKTITISIPCLEIDDQKICHLGNTSEILGEATLKQMYLLAYHFVLKVLYLQGTHNWKIETLLTDLREALHISSEEHANELRSITSGQYK